MINPIQGKLYRIIRNTSGGFKAGTIVEFCGEKSHISDSYRFKNVSTGKTYLHFMADVEEYDTFPIASPKSYD